MMTRLHNLKNSITPLTSQNGEESHLGCGFYQHRPAVFGNGFWDVYTEPELFRSPLEPAAKHSLEVLA